MLNFASLKYHAGKTHKLICLPLIACSIMLVTSIAGAEETTATELDPSDIITGNERVLKAYKEVDDFIYKELTCKFYQCGEPREPPHVTIDSQNSAILDGNVSWDVTVVNNSPIIAITYFKYFDVSVDRKDGTNCIINAATEAPYTDSGDGYIVTPSHVDLKCDGYSGLIRDRSTFMNTERAPFDKDANSDNITFEKLFCDDKDCNIDRGYIDVYCTDDGCLDTTVRFNITGVVNKKLRYDEVLKLNVPLSNEVETIDITNTPPPTSGQTFSEDDKNIVIIQFVIPADTETRTLTAITLEEFDNNTGDRPDIDMFRLFHDIDQDGQVGPDDTELMENNFTTANESIQIQLSPPLTIPSEGAKLLITYDL